MRSSRSHKRHRKTVSSVREENKNTSSVKCGETVDNNVTVDNNDLGTYSSISNTANTVYSGLILLLYFYSRFFVQHAVPVISASFMQSNSFGMKLLYLLTT